ncbi:MAG: hypothetical protein HOI95_28250 [Chromatiales bacterium]|nr:hypothetical protein [Chromatiales bacterium]
MTSNLSDLRRSSLTQLIQLTHGWHVAGSANDVLGASAYGMSCVWSNRHRDVLVDAAYPPAIEIANLAESASVLP